MNPTYANRKFKTTKEEIAYFAGVEDGLKEGRRLMKEILR